MILRSIRLRGFRGFSAGIGVDEVFLDLSVLPDGLVAVCGPNGAGKTTLLDNLHPYRIQPYKIRKAKDWSPGAFSYYDQCSGSDACKELVFEMGGVAYRALILIDAERRKQEAYLYQASSVCATVPVWTPLNDGKVKTYDEAVEKVCGSPSLFFTSVFRCQGAKNLSDYTRGDIMQIISELLNIDHIREQSEKCRTVVSGLSAGLILARDRMVGLAAESEAATGLELEISRVTINKTTDQLGLDGAQGDLDGVRTEIIKVREQQAAQESEAVRLEMLKSQLSDEEKRLVDGGAAAVKAIADIDRRIADAVLSRDRAKVGLQDNIDNAIKSRDNSKAGLQERIARAEKIISGGAGIRNAVAKESGLLEGIDREKSSLARLTKERDERRGHLSKWGAELSGLNAEIKALEQAVAKLDGLDCHGDASGWLNPSCRFIADAVAGRDSLPESIAHRDTLQADILKMQGLLSESDNAVGDCDRTLVSAEDALKECQKFTRLLPELDQAEANLVVWNKDLADLDKQADASVAAWCDAMAGLDKRADDDLKALGGDKWLAESEWDLARIRISDRITELRRDIEAFPVFGDLAGQLRELSIREGISLAAVTSLEKRIHDADIEIASLRTKMEAAQAKCGELILLKEKEGKLAAEIAKFTLLMKACSNDGIVALELDDAAPSIASIVNDLLRACYGSRFTVRLDTQAAKVNGDMKETFDIIIFDADAGDEKSITECSGGQVTVLEDAITRGICLYNIHRSDRVYGTLYSDEKDGALDEARKLEFMRVKREALRVGTHRHEFFITQTQDLVDMADARIVLAPGGVVIQ
jgi:exonuclease SbcC